MLVCANRIERFTASYCSTYRSIVDSYTDKINQSCTNSNPSDVCKILFYLREMFSENGRKYCSTPFRAPSKQRPVGDLSPSGIKAARRSGSGGRGGRGGRGGGGGGGGRGGGRGGGGRGGGGRGSSGTNNSSGSSGTNSSSASPPATPVPEPKWTYLDTFTIMKSNNNNYTYTASMNLAQGVTLRMADFDISGKKYIRLEKVTDQQGVVTTLVPSFSKGMSQVTYININEPLTNSDGSINPKGVLEVDRVVVPLAEGDSMRMWTLAGRRHSTISWTLPKNNDHLKTDVSGYKVYKSLGNESEALEGKYLQASPLLLGSEYPASQRAGSLAGKAVFASSSKEDCAAKCNSIGACGAFTFYESGKYMDTNRNCKLMPDLVDDPPSGYTPHKKMESQKKQAPVSPPIAMYPPGGKAVQTPLDSWALPGYTAVYSIQPRPRHSAMGRKIDATQYDGVYVNQSDKAKIKAYVMSGGKRYHLAGGYGAKLYLTENPDAYIPNSSGEDFFGFELLNIPLSQMAPPTPTSTRNAGAVMFKNTKRCYAVGMRVHGGTARQLAYIRSLAILDFSDGRSAVKAQVTDEFDNSRETVYYHVDGNSYTDMTRTVSTGDIVLVVSIPQPLTGYIPLYLFNIRNTASSFRVGDDGNMMLMLNMDRVDSSSNIRRFQLKSFQIMINGTIQTVTLYDQQRYYVRSQMHIAIPQKKLISSGSLVDNTDTLPITTYPVGGG